MPSLLRFLAVIALIVGTIYGGLYALARFYIPVQREITVAIPPDRFSKQK